VFSPPLWNCVYASVACAASLSKLTASRWLERLQAASLVMVPETYFSPASSGYQTNLHEIINFLMFSTAISSYRGRSKLCKDRAIVYPNNVYDTIMFSSFYFE
jgi:hypothetical protein